MERYNKIIEHQTFIHYLNEIEEIEKDRIYCRHNLVHLLDVARIAYIKNLEAGSPFSKDMIYGAALLHDIGKVEQYKEKIPHEITGAKKAVDMLIDKMEDYANFGFAYINEKMEDNPEYFYKESAFIRLFMGFTGTAVASDQNEEEPESLD